MSAARMAFRETLEFKQGRTAEELVATELRRRGWYVIPSYDYSGEDDKAPRLHGPHEVSWVLPDLDVCRGGVRRWVEVKYKSAAAHVYSPRQRVRPDCPLQHGISLRLVEHYRRVREQSGCEVWICIYEGNTRLVLIQNLAVLEQQESAGRRWHHILPPGQFDQNDRHGMFFFSRADLIMWATIDPLPMADPGREREEAEQ